MTDPAPWRRLDARMLAVRPVQILGRAILPLGALVLFGRGESQQWTAVVGGVLVVLAGVTHWLTTRYRIGPTQVELTTGLLRRRRVSVPLDRIRGVDVTATPLHRILRLAVVKVGTGRHEGGEHSELSLDAVSAEEAARLRDELLHRALPGEETATPPGQRETVLARLDLRWVRYAPFTLSGVITVAAVAGFVANFVNDVRLDVSNLGTVERLVHQLGGAPLVLVVVAAALLFLVLTSLLSVAGYLLSFWGFVLTRHPGGSLHVRRGLLTTRAVSLEERRLRGVEVDEPLGLRIPGAAKLSAIASGAVAGADSAALLLPPAPRAEAERVASDVLRDPGPTTAPLTAHGAAARRRRYVRALVPAAVLVAGLYLAHVVADLPSWPWHVALLAVPIALLLATDRYRNLGHALTDRFLVGRNGSLLRTTFALERDGIIGWRLHQSLFQRRAGLLTVTATTAGGNSAYHVPDVPVEVGVRLADEAVPGLLTPFLIPERDTRSVS